MYFVYGTLLMMMMIIMMIMMMVLLFSFIQSKLLDADPCNMLRQQAMLRFTHPTVNEFQIVIIFWILGQAPSLYASPL